MIRHAVVLGVALAALSCESLARFDTRSGEPFCGPIVGAQFVRTPESEGGFRARWSTPSGYRVLGARLELDTDSLTTTPGSLSTNDAGAGPCGARPTFDRAPLRVTPEVVHDSLSSMEFEDGQVQNLVAWVDSTCRGPMLAVVSLYKNDRVGLRLMKPRSAPPTAGATATPERDAFALFSLDRRDQADCP